MLFRSRHIRYADARALRAVVHTEYNIEGYPSRDFIDLVLECRPEQVTLVPDGPDVLTSNAGWDTLAHAGLLREVVAEFRSAGIRTSLFIECDAARIEGARHVGADRIELYTEAYAQGYEAALKANGRRDSRHRVEHVEVVHPDDIPRFAELGVIASMQPPHPPGNHGLPLEPYLSRIGEQRWPWAFAWSAMVM